MIPFSPAHVAYALAEGIESITTRFFEGDEKILSIIHEFLYDRPIWCKQTTQLSTDLFAHKKKQLLKLLTHCDTKSLEYKRFSYIAQWLWNYMNPELNPFFYDKISIEKGISAQLMLMGLTQQVCEQECSPFKLNENIATTAGYVIHEDEYLQLIYYPTRKKLYHQSPVFIVPPWINKYYIFDLSQHNSYISWLLNANIPVYCISWVNPDRSYSHQTLAHYVQQGIDGAVQKAYAHSNNAKLNMIGYCIGGVALLTYAGWVATTQKKQRIASLTFLATPFDFEKLDGLNLFMDEEQYKTLLIYINEEGVFKGEQMMQAFSLLRCNDVLIQNVIDQIYREKKQKPLDFLYWNADITHIPRQLHSDYLRTIFLTNNVMKQPKSIGSIDVNFDQINCPVFVFAAQKDYIVPWESSFAASKVLKHVTFCLGGSGHVVGVINPPSQQKYGFHTGTIGQKSAEQWVESAHFNEGSWWNCWHTWVKPSLGALVKAKRIKDDLIIEPAPGRYALQKAPKI